VEFKEECSEKQHMFLNTFLYELCHAFIHLVRILDYAHTDIATILDCIESIFCDEYEKQLDSFSN